MEGNDWTLKQRIEAAGSLIYDSQPDFSEAACNDPSVDPEIFHPEQGGSSKEAKKVCGRCLITDACLGYALKTNQKSGVFGGLTPSERNKLK